MNKLNYVILSALLFSGISNAETSNFPANALATQACVAGWTKDAPKNALKAGGGTLLLVPSFIVDAMAGLEIGPVYPALSHVGPMTAEGYEGLLSCKYVVEPRSTLAEGEKNIPRPELIEAMSTSDRGYYIYSTVSK
jgi:hypothetical protein